MKKRTNNVQLQAIRQEYHNLQKAIDLLTDIIYYKYTGVLFNDNKVIDICDNLEEIQQIAYNTLRIYEKIYINEHLKS